MACFGVRHGKLQTCTLCQVLYHCKLEGGLRGMQGVHRGVYRGVYRGVKAVKRRIKRK